MIPLGFSYDSTGFIVTEQYCDGLELSTARLTTRSRRRRARATRHSRSGATTAATRTATPPAAVPTGPRIASSDLTARVITDESPPASTQNPLSPLLIGASTGDRSPYGADLHPHYRTSALYAQSGRVQPIRTTETSSNSELLILEVPVIAIGSDLGPPGPQPSSRTSSAAGIKRPSEHDQVPPGLQVPSEAYRREGPDLRSAP